MREGYRAEAGCQIVHDSILRRGMADAYLLRGDGKAAGYGGVWNQLDPGRVMEFYVSPELRQGAGALFEALVEASGAHEIESQTNMPSMFEMLRRFGEPPAVDGVLFADAADTFLESPGTFRRACPSDDRSLFPAGVDTIADWVIEHGGRVVAEGGVLYHYNPPYGDVFMEVAEPMRRKGYGSYLVQELRRVCRESGNVPAARCRPDNLGSRRALEKGGFAECGQMLVATLSLSSGTPGGDG